MFIDKIKKYLSVKKWFGSRMPISDVVKLEQRSTYILPTKAGLLFFVIILLMMVGATNYQNNLAFLLTFLISSIGLVSIISTFKNLQGLTFKLGSVESVCVGDKLQLTIYVSSSAGHAHHSISAGFSKQQLFYRDINPLEGNYFLLPIKVSHRGWYYIPRIITTSKYPFGFFRVWSWFKFSTPVLIYPQPIEPPIDGGLGMSDEESGENKILGNDDLYGLKNYQAGDPLSRIDWKALARERGMLVKEFVSYQSQDLVFNWNDFAAVNDELKLSYLCFLVNEAGKNNFEYSLRLPNQTINKSSGKLHQENCLKALALYGLEDLAK